MHAAKLEKDTVAENIGNTVSQGQIKHSVIKKRVNTAGIIITPLLPYQSVANNTENEKGVYYTSSEKMSNIFD